MVDQIAKLQMKLLDSEFHFSKRMLNLFDDLEILTVRDLAVIPLTEFICFRGFKQSSKSELIAFIEFEQLNIFFTGFDDWKKWGTI